MAITAPAQAINGNDTDKGRSDRGGGGGDEFG